MSSSGRVCARCSQIKQRCDGEFPCSRCSRLGHVCEPRGSSQSCQDSTVTRRRPRASRSRSGCLACKTRKKKCDEVKPRCSDCRRLNIPCRWPSTSSNHSEPSPSAETTTLTVSEPTYLSDSVLSDSPISLDNDPILLSDILFEDHALSLPNPWPCISSNPHLTTKEDKSLFNHYLNTVARVLSRSGDQDSNPFLITLLPIATASDTVTSVILGLSGCHWRRVYPSIWNCALARQGKALGQINSLLGLPDPQSTLEACTAILLLCLTELFDGTSRVWKWHLKAASAILKSPGMNALVSSAEWAFCTNLFHYLDAMSTISRCKPPLIHNGDSLADLSTVLVWSSIPSTGSDHSTEAIYGIPPTLFDFLGMVNLLAKHRSRRVDELSEIGFRTAASQIERQIDDWRIQHDLLGVTTDKDAESSTTAFEWAVRLRLHQIVNGYDPNHDHVQHSVATILDAILEVPYGSRVEGCLLFPLVIAGASCTGIERRMMVKERLMVMESTLGFGHIKHARQLLETVWRKGDHSKEPNWAYVRYNQFPGIVFI